MRSSVLALILLVAGSTVAGSTEVEPPACGSGVNGAICMGSIDRTRRLTPAQRARLSQVGRLAIDVISSPEFLSELEAFHRSYDWRSRGDEHRAFWATFDPSVAVQQTRNSFSGLRVDTKGGAGGWLGATFAGNLAYEGSDLPDGTREFLLNRNRLDRPTSQLAATYVHEASHKAGLSHRKPQNGLQKCEPPYVMGQIVIKLTDPAEWTRFVRTSNVCSHWRQ